LTKLEKLAMGKHSSLLQKSVNYGYNMFYDSSHCLFCHKINGEEREEKFYKIATNLLLRGDGKKEHLETATKFLNFLSLMLDRGPRLSTPTTDLSNGGAPSGSQGPFPPFSPFFSLRALSIPPRGSSSPRLVRLRHNIAAIYLK
jgi:hypothetical protein